MDHRRNIVGIAWKGPANEILIAEDVDTVRRRLPSRRRVEVIIIRRAGAMEPDRCRGVGAIPAVKFRDQCIGVLARGQGIAAAGHVQPVAAVPRHLFHQVDAVVGERRHDRVRPPVAVILPGLGGRETHRRVRIDQDHITDRVCDAQIIRDRNSRNAGSDNGDIAIESVHLCPPSAYWMPVSALGASCHARSIPKADRPSAGYPPFMMTSTFTGPPVLDAAGEPTA